ncbi:MAG: response regulator, partial [Oscillospiraceae bacterium]|nr:response regulator [Oscillospiraceae bacterium]
TVLIVDDSSLMRRLIKNIVVKNGYDVLGEAENGKKGVEKYKELKPDFVTMDLIMDEMNGLEALKLIIEEDPNANVIMVSSMGQEVLVRDAIVLGAKHFVMKPFDERQVMEAIKKL